MSQEKAPWERFGPELKGEAAKPEAEKAPWDRFSESRTEDLERNIAGATGATLGTGISLARGLGSGTMFGAQKLGEAFRGPQPPPATGTSGQKWLQNWADIKKEGVGGVPEAAQVYERQKPHGKVSGRVYKMFGNQPLDIAGYMAAQKPMSLEQTTSIFKRMMESTPIKAFGRYAVPPLSLYGSAVDIHDIMAEQEQPEPDRLKQALSAISGLSGLAALYPPLTLPAGAVSLGASGLQNLRENIQQSAKVPRENLGLPVEYGLPALGQ